MKKLWQCSVLSSTLRVAVPSLASHLRENGKPANCNEHQNRETEVFWHKKIEKPIQKDSRNRKTENPNAPLPHTAKVPNSDIKMGEPFTSYSLHLDAM